MSKQMTKMNNVMMTEIKGENITFSSVFKNQFKNWNLKDYVSLTPEKVDAIEIKQINKVKIYYDQPVEDHYLLKIEECKSL